MASMKCSCNKILKIPALSAVELTAHTNGEIDWGSTTLVLGTTQPETDFYCKYCGVRYKIIYSGKSAKKFTVKKAGKDG